jgi:hypothetical protein
MEIFGITADWCFVYLMQHDGLSGQIRQLSKSWILRSNADTEIAWALLLPALIAFSGGMAFQLISIEERHPHIVQTKRCGSQSVKQRCLCNHRHAAVCQFAISIY